MSIQEVLTGGDPRSLGRTEEVVDGVLAKSLDIHELFECIFAPDEIVRLRAGDALEKVCRSRPEMVAPFTERLLQDVPQIRQPSVQWHLAQMLCELPLTDRQTDRAVRLLEYNLHTIDEWVLTNLTLEALAVFTRKGALSTPAFITLLEQFASSRHKSVASRVQKLRKEFAANTKGDQ